MALTRQQRHFREMIQALQFAAPVVLASHYETGLAHCVEISICGALALTSRKIKARAIPCAITAVNPSEGLQAAVGLGAKDMYERLSRSNDAHPSFEEWMADKRFPDLEADTCPTHMVIEARYHGERAIIDLTLGQLRQSHGIDVHLTMHHFGEGWREFDAAGWRLRYIDSPYAEEIQKNTSSFKDKGIVGDLEALMGVAVQSGLDFERYMATLRQIQPGVFATASARLERFMALADPYA